MNNFSVIIPTIWKGPWIYDLLERFCNNEYVDDIILINNNQSDSKEIPNSPKINIVTPEENLFVNPSWNLGVSLAKNKNIIISNDDIIFDVDLYINSLQHLDPLYNFGIIGMNTDNYNIVENEEITLSAHGKNRKTPPVNHEFGGWGCLLAISKRKWVNIPEQLKIWYGDNFLQIMCGPPLDLRGIAIKTKMTSSADEKIEWVKNIIINDSKEWFNILGGR